MSDTELERAAARQESLPRAARWMFWPTELYSFGRTYREWLRWPTWLPLPAYGDHGAVLMAQLQPHELENPARVHLTFNRERAVANRGLPDREVVHVMNPWVRYRRRHVIEPHPDAKGTLVFYAHTNVGIELDEEYDVDGYIGALMRLPNQYQPVVLGLHMHDIDKGYHRHLRRYGLPIVSAGNTSSPYFVDRFYDLLRRFSFASSNVGGSEVYYATELGVPFFLHGEEPARVNLSHPQNPLGRMRAPDDLARRLRMAKRDAFSVFPPKITRSQRDLTRLLLGLDAPDNARKLRRTLALELLRLAPFHLRAHWSGRIARARERGWRGTLLYVTRRLLRR